MTGLRSTMYLMNNLGEALPTYQSALRMAKAICDALGLCSSAVGYLGDLELMVMLGQILLLYPEATPCMQKFLLV